ncbi:hypothetical protein HDU98_003792 [Podochytrium sp. JEL0797]|nr:hypothetical protein HDU98_003792 [Podochytrium sp. JEL0797]
MRRQVGGAEIKTKTELPTATSQPATGSNVASMQFSLCMKPSLEPFLTGPEAAELIGDTSNTDILLQPSPGEIIAVHSSYLLRNPYFTAHLSFAEGQHKSLEMPMKINRPYPAHFRVNLECIYANTPEFAVDKIAQNSFVPLAVIAHFCQM